MRLTPTAPITADDVRHIKKLLLKAMTDKNLWQDAAHEPRTQFICTLAIDWQSEDKSVIQRISRFDLAYIDGQTYEGYAVPYIYAEERADISQMFEMVANAHIADSKGWLTVPIDEFLRGLPQGVTHDCQAIALWEDCGALIFTVLSDGCEESVVCNANIMSDGVFCALLENNEQFKSCRSWQEDWLRNNPQGWEI
jgi:hypothetical protein